MKANILWLMDHSWTKPMALAILLMLGVSLIPLGEGHFLSSSKPRPLPPPVPQLNATVTAVVQAYPHVGGFMTGSYFGVSAVEAEFTFAGTNPAVIQSDNRLIAGVFETVYDKKTHGLDYAYRGVVILQNDGSMYVAGDAYVDCEGFPLQRPNCGRDQYVNLLYDTGSISIIAGVTSVILIRMAFGTDSHVRWYYQVDASPLTAFGDFAPPKTSQSQFIVGEYTDSYTGVVSRNFQFAVESDYNIDNPGWFVSISYPSYLLNGQWTLVPEAEAVQGSLAHLDRTYKWGGADYTNVDAQYDYNSDIGPFHLRLFFSASTLADGQLLWPGPHLYWEIGGSGSSYTFQGPLMGCNNGGNDISFTLDVVHGPWYNIFPVSVYSIGINVLSYNAPTTVVVHVEASGQPPGQNDIGMGTYQNMSLTHSGWVDVPYPDPAVYENATPTYYVDIAFVSPDPNAYVVIAGTTIYQTGYSSDWLGSRFPSVGRCYSPFDLYADARLGWIQGSPRSQSSPLSNQLITSAYIVGLGSVRLRQDTNALGRSWAAASEYTGIQFNVQETSEGARWCRNFK